MSRFVIVQQLNRHTIGQVLASMRTDPDSRWQTDSADSAASLSLSAASSLPPAKYSKTYLDLNHREQFNEGITLIEDTNTQEAQAGVGAWAHGMQSACKKRFTSYFADEEEDDVEEFLIRDDTMKMLDTYVFSMIHFTIYFCWGIHVFRIRGLTTKTLHLESKLRQQYLDNKRSKFLSGGETLSLG